MAVSGVEAVLEFLIKNGFAEAESALRDDIVERGELGSFDFEKFMFPITALPPPVKITVGGRQSEVSEGVDCSGSSSDSSDDFVSVDSSTTDVSHSGFTNPYGLWSAAEVKSEASSDRPSEFGTAREYPDLDMLNDMYWCDENDEGCPMYPCFRESDVFCCPSEDKFVMTSEVERQWDNNLPLNATLEEFHTATRINYLDKPCIANSTKNYVVKEFPLNEYCHWDENVLPEHGMEEESVPNCDCCVGEKRFHGQNSEDYNHLESLKEPELSNFQLKILCESPFDCDPASEHKISTSSNHSFKKHDLDMESQNYPGLNFQADEKAFQPNEDIGCEIANGAEMDGRTHQPAATGEEEEGITANELPICSINEDEFEIFELRIIHRKNRTGFEEHKDLPIVLNAIVAGRYYVTEYLGSAAFSKVVQAHDLHTGMDVCLKIIKNDKDFFDQSLDEIKLLKFVNKHDPADEHHILRLYDYFYHQEHLFIVCELLHANLYEFQKFNQDSGGEAYFTMHRLQVITRQCLEALEFLHSLGIMHCDLKPENILMKSYRRCEIKVIDLGSSCFQTDNLCLYVQSRSYRAPEVILGLPYDQKIDIWSLGCILAELSSGEVLFPNDTLVMLLARIIGMLGPIDMEMLVGGQETQNYFTEEYDLYHLNEETNQVEYIIPEESSLERHLRVSDSGFIEFIKDMLELNPGRRLTAREALEHPWLSYPYEPNCS